MTNANTYRLVEKLKAEIEKQLNWGHSSSWGNYDFEKLSEQMADKTSVLLSVTTLKRIFGKANYQSEPSMTTLNALAKFAGHADFREFVAQSVEKSSLVENPQAKRFRMAIRPKALVGIVLSLLILASLLILGFVLFKKDHPYNPADFSFSSRTILTAGVPNSVIFDFDASKASDHDSVYISQSWDLRRKILVNKNDKHYSTIYYYPGYYRAKLMVGDKVIKEHDLQIKTDGWLGVAAKDWNIEPIYFKKTEIESNGEISVSATLLKKYKLYESPHPPAVYFFNEKDVQGIYSDNFVLETTLKGDLTDSSNACRYAEVSLVAKNDAMIVPLISPGCVGSDIFFMAFGYEARSRYENLSGFGCNLGNWTRLKVQCTNGDLTIFINDVSAYTAKIKNRPTEIVGVQLGFNGAGSFKNTVLKNASQTVQF